MWRNNSIILQAAKWGQERPVSWFRVWQETKVGAEFYELNYEGLCRVQWKHIGRYVRRKSYPLTVKLWEQNFDIILILWGQCVRSVSGFPTLFVWVLVNGISPRQFNTPVFQVTLQSMKRYWQPLITVLLDAKIL